MYVIHLLYKGQFEYPIHLLGFWLIYLLSIKNN